MKENKIPQSVLEAMKVAQNAQKTMEALLGSYDSMIGDAVSQAESPADKIKLQQFVKESSKLIDDAKKGKSIDVNSLINKYGRNGNK